MTLGCILQIAAGICALRDRTIAYAVAAADHTLGSYPLETGNPFLGGASIVAAFVSCGGACCADLHNGFGEYGF